jgi:hypothetical protein
MAGRLKFDALFPITSVVDPDVEPGSLQVLVCLIRPVLAPFREQLAPVPLGRLKAKTVRGQLAHRQHYVGVGVTLIPMDIEIGDHAAGDKLALDELSR